MKQEIRFYVTMILGYVLLIIGCFVPPIGYISDSVLIAAGMMMCLAGLMMGLDIKGIIHEFRLLKKDLFEYKKADDTNAG